jgi:hypothetical protein
VMRAKWQNELGCNRPANSGRAHLVVVEHRRTACESQISYVGHCRHMQSTLELAA